MIVIDVNLLIYAYSKKSPHHRRAKEWLEAVLASDEPIGIPLQVILAFLRISTSPNIPGQHATIKAALEVVESWLQVPGVRIVEPGERHWNLFKSLVSKSSASGNRLMDAHLAALALEHGAVLCSADSDFARFPGLRWKNPLLKA